METITPTEEQQKKINRIVEIFNTGNVVLDKSQTGTGKTISAVAAIKVLNMPTLVVAPKKVHTSWRRAAEAMEASHLLLDVINVEKLRFKNKWYKDDKWHIPAGSLVTVDECHRGCAGPETKTTEIMAKLKAYPVKVLAMSATMASSPLQLRFLGFLAGLHRYNKPDFYDWCMRNGCKRVERRVATKYGYVSRQTIEFARGKKAETFMAGIAEATKGISVCMTTDDIPGFPESVLQANLYDLGAKDVEALKEAYRLLNLAKANDAMDMTALLRIRQEAEKIKVPLFVQLAKEAVEDEKAPVIFVSFRDTVFGIRDELAKLGITAGLVIGGQDCTADIDKFQKDELNAVVGTSASGIGISLHATGELKPRLSYISPDYNPVITIQVLGRIHRFGGSKVVQTFVMVADTVEESVHKAVTRKLRCIDKLNGEDLGVL